MYIRKIEIEDLHNIKKVHKHHKVTRMKNLNAKNKLCDQVKETHLRNVKSGEEAARHV